MPVLSTITSPIDAGLEPLPIVSSLSSFSSSTTINTTTNNSSGQSATTAVSTITDPYPSSNGNPLVTDKTAVLQQRLQTLSLNTSEIPSGTAVFYQYRGTEAFLQGKFTEAMEAFSTSIDLEPTNVNHYSNRSAAYLACGHISDFRKALDDANKCIELAPENCRGYYRKGLALRSLAQFHSAYTILQQGLTLAQQTATKLVNHQFSSSSTNHSDSNDSDEGAIMAVIMSAVASGYTNTLTPTLPPSTSSSSSLLHHPNNSSSAISPSSNTNLRLQAAYIHDFQLALAELQRMSLFEGPSTPSVAATTPFSASSSSADSDSSNSLIPPALETNISDNKKEDFSQTSNQKHQDLPSVSEGKVAQDANIISTTSTSSSSSVYQDLVIDHIEKEELADTDRFTALEDWLISRGKSTFPYLYMRRYGEGNRGVHMRNDVPGETEIMAIGLDYLITVEMGKMCPIGRKIAEAGIERDLSASKHCYLAIYVMWDRKNTASFYAPYYAILPEAYPNMPIFWSSEELQWLQGSYLLQQIEDRKTNIKADYDLIVSIAPEFNNYSLEEFAWARMMVASRNFGIIVDGIRTDALVPYADMLNHSRPRQTRWAFDSRKRQFVIISMHPLHVGSQVFDSYGKKCNSRFLLNYGFTVDNNTDEDIGQNHNEVRLFINILASNEDPWYFRKQELLGIPPTNLQNYNGNGITVSTGTLSSETTPTMVSRTPSRTLQAMDCSGIGTTHSLSNGTPGSSLRTSSILQQDLISSSSSMVNCNNNNNILAASSPLSPVPLSSVLSLPGRAVRISTFYECDSTVEAFSFLRFVHANTKEIPYLPRLDDDFDLARRPIPPLSPDNEIGVLQHLASLCQHQLSLYPSTLADDNHILDSQQYSYGSNRRNALVLVKGEKEVCHFYIALAKLAVPILQMRWPEANTLITKQYSQINNDAHKYIRSIVGPLLQKHFENTAIDLGTLGNNNSTATISGHRSGGFNYGYSTNNGGGYL